MYAQKLTSNFTTAEHSSRMLYHQKKKICNFKLCIQCSVHNY